jgi:putative endonuclease
MTIKKGAAAETQALVFLQQQGLRLIARNFRCRGGEIDLILLDQYKTLVFVEVRLRQNNHYASAAESITPSKQHRIIRTAQYFLLTHPQYQDCNLRFDGVLFASLNQSPEWITSAFDA